MMSKLFTIIRREYLGRVRNKTFIIATALAPIMMVVLVVVPALLAGIKMGDAARMAIVDETGKLAEPVRHAIDRSMSEAPPGENLKTRMAGSSALRLHREQCSRKLLAMKSKLSS
ncbi:MAG: hypothetical protein WKF84_07785 [Pyrinomonadaceae bacterium]